MDFTRARLFYKSNRHMSWSNPARRWLWHRVGFAFTVGAFVFVPVSSFISSKLCAEGYGFATNETLSILELLPLNAACRFWGYIAGNQFVPSNVHSFLIRWFVRLNGIESFKEADLTKFETLQDFFTRPHNKLDVDDSSAVCLVAPCDGVVTQAGEVPPNGSELIQVKGCSYRFDHLFRAQLVAPAAETRRVFFTIYLRMKDVHHFYSPTQMVISQTTCCPGTVFPTSLKWMRYFPQLFVTNERVNVLGASQYGALGMSCIGGLCRGLIYLKYDERVSSNMLHPPEFTLRWNYDHDDRSVNILRGQELGHFGFGSSIVLVADVPNRAKIVPTVGDVVRAGKPLVR